MNASTRTTKNRLFGTRRGISGLCVIALLTTTAPSAMAAASMVAAPAQVIVAQEPSKAPGEQRQKDSSHSSTAMKEPKGSSPDAGTLALLALGLIALGVTRRKVRD